MMDPLKNYEPSVEDPAGEFRREAEKIESTMPIGTTARQMTLRDRLVRDRTVLLGKRAEVDEKVQRINSLIDDIDRDPRLAARFDELLVAVMSDKFKPPARY